MSKRKKRMRLPSGWGSIKYLGKGRRNPYAVHPPAKECNEKGHYKQPTPLCYVDDWNVGFAVLTAYRAGTYKKGDELKFKAQISEESEDITALVERILADAASLRKDEDLPTLKDVYEMWSEWKWGENREKEISRSQINKYKYGFGYFKSLHDRKIAEIKLNDLQMVFNQSEHGKATLHIMKTTISQIYGFAISREIVDKDPTRHIVIPSKAKDDEPGVPFSENELIALWEECDKGDEDAELAIIMCYSGFRRGELMGLETNLEDMYFKGGIKTEAGKNRIVPIHSCIQDFVKKRMGKWGALTSWTGVSTTGLHFSNLMKRLGLEHTCHDARHTFSWLCEKFDVNEADQKRLMGHSFGSDITKAVYGHRDLEDLRKEIEKIKPPAIRRHGGCC